MCIINSCSLKEKYGEYCYKHRREYLVDINTNQIIIEKWTNKSSDYLKNDIISTLQQFNVNGCSNLNKKELFIILCDKINFFKKYDSKDIQKIIQLQKYIKKNKKNPMNKLRGKAYYDKKLCNNDSDFYTYDHYNEIDDKYFFSYEDENKFIWFFDIRSFNKLIEMRQPNPYTMKPIPREIIKKAKKLLKLLKLNSNENIMDQHQINLTRKQIIKQKVIDMCIEINQCGYDCQPEWFYTLNIQYLKKLYRNLEDLWNYRAQLSNEVKSRICPPNGLIYNIPVSEVYNYTSKLSVLDIILNETMKFNNAVNIDDKKLGYMYFLIGLGSVSKDCYDSHPWLMYV